LEDKLIYLDNAATTKIKLEVLDVMLPYFKEYYGNPSALYDLAQINKKAVDEARALIERSLNAEENSIYFTSGGSEADNWAIKGVAIANKFKGNHIITSKIEHHAVLHTLQYLEKHGFEVTYLDVDKFGFISLEELKNSIKDTTILITIMAANNEIGTIQDLNAIGKIAKEHNILFHTDAVQAVSKMDIDLTNIDLMSISAHKIHGPKGIGALYIKKGTKIDNLIHGGGQELNKRAGNENVAMMVGFAKALELSLKEDKQAILKLRNKLIDGILNSIPESYLNGDREKRLYNNVNISFHYVEGEAILLLLNKEGIAASSGSACTSKSLEPSHVLLALGVDYDLAHSSTRFTLSEYTTEDEIDFVIDLMPKIIKRLREISPLNGKEE